MIILVKLFNKITYQPDNYYVNIEAEYERLEKLTSLEADKCKGLVEKLNTRFYPVLFPEKRITRHIISHIK